jgi:hypothetical protein
MVARSRRAKSCRTNQDIAHSKRPSRRFGAARVCRCAMARSGYPGSEFAPWLDGHGERERWGASPSGSAPHAPPAPPRYGAPSAALYDPRAGAPRSGHPSGPYAAHSASGSRLHPPPPLPGLQYAPPPASAAWSRSAPPPPRGHYAPPPPSGYHALPAVRAPRAQMQAPRPGQPPRRRRRARPARGRVARGLTRRRARPNAVRRRRVVQPRRPPRPRPPCLCAC